MSAVGHKRTFAAQKAMSALPPKADMCGATGDVRFMPIADIEGSKLDDLRSRPSKCRARPRTRDTDSLVYSSKLNVWVDIGQSPLARNKPLIWVKAFAVRLCKFGKLS